MGPLAGYRIIEIKGIGPGPYAGMLLADLGAEVIVVERKNEPPGLTPPSEMDIFSRGKTVVALDLKSDEGREALLTLVAKADAVFEGFRPGVAERLGIGPEPCLERNPKIVYGRMTGWGQTGPLSATAGHDINYISLTGVLAAIGTSDKPVIPLNLIGDFAGGSLFLVTGLLAALLETQKSGRGQVVDAAITDGSAHLMTLFYTLSRMGLWGTQRQHNMLDGGAPFYGVYQTRDGGHVSVGALEPQFFSELIDTLELSAHFKREQNNPAVWPELKEALAQAFGTRTREEWGQIFADRDACVTPVLNYEEAAGHAHNVARKSYVELNGVTQPAPAPRFSRSDCDAPCEPHMAGAGIDEILSHWTFTEAEVGVLKRAE